MSSSWVKKKLLGVFSFSRMMIEDRDTKKWRPNFFSGAHYSKLIMPALNYPPNLPFWIFN